VQVRLEVVHPTYGTSSVNANAFAALTRRARTREPRSVTRGDGIDLREGPARFDECFGHDAADELACARARDLRDDAAEAACRSTWLDTTLERMSWPSSTIAAAVSSQLVSIPRIATNAAPAR